MFSSIFFRSKLGDYGIKTLVVEKHTSQEMEHNITSRSYYISFVLVGGEVFRVNMPLICEGWL
jgi:hypothetical protein